MPRIDDNRRPERDAEVRRLLREGVSYRQTARLVGLSLAGVQKAAKRPVAPVDLDDVDELTAVSAAAGKIDPARLDALERLRLARLPGPVGDRARAEASARIASEISEAGSVNAWCERGW